jgi:hypothetical protein
MLNTKKYSSYRDNVWEFIDIFSIQTQAHRRTNKLGKKKKIVSTKECSGQISPGKLLIVNLKN